MGREVSRQEGLLGNSQALDWAQAPTPPCPQPLPAGNRGFIDIMDMPNTNKYSFDG